MVDIRREVKGTTGKRKGTIGTTEGREIIQHGVGRRRGEEDGKGASRGVGATDLIPSK